VTRDGTLLFSPRQVFLALGGACAAAIPVMLLLQRSRMASIAGAVSFGAAALLSACIGMWWAQPPGHMATIRRVVALTALGMSAALPGWYFGPSSAYAGVVAILLVFSGLVMGGVGTPFPPIAAWSVYVALAGSQAVVATLIFVGALPDVGLLPVRPVGSTAWHHVAAHVVVQLVYAAAFVIGRGLHRVYWRISEQLEQATRAAARRDALLDEARAEYRRMFALGQEGIFAGRTLGQFQLGDLIARGGAGEVYAATDVRDGSQVAVKVLRGDKLDDPASVQGFLDEGTALTRVTSPHVVKATHVGGPGEVLPYIAMERLDGQTLAQLVADGGPLSRADALALARGGAEALAAIHAAGIQHGDVNPTNLIRADGVWKLIDFGIATMALGDASGGRPADGPVPGRGSDARTGHGTLRYLAPERLSGPPSARADIYGLAASLYFALTGRAPFEDVAAPGLAHAIAREMPLDPRLVGDVSDEVAEALAGGLATAPAARRADFGSAIVAALEGKAVGAAPDHVAPAWRVDPIASSPLAQTTTAVRAESLLAPAQDERPAASAPPVGTARGGQDATPPASPPPEVVPMRASIANIEVVADKAWKGAFVDRLRLQFAAMFAACIGGAALIALVVSRPIMLVVGIGSIALAGVVLLVERARGLEWPWIVVAALSIGPAYVLGLHSAYAAVLAVTLFVECSFQATESTLIGRGYTLTAILVSHATTYALVVTGVIPDGAVTPVRHHGLAEGLVVELMVLGVFVVAFMMGRLVQTRYVDLVRRNEAAARGVAAEEALLASARAEIERVLAGYAGGLFTGATIGGYRVEKLLGRGGMGEVYSAQRAGQQVALKIIRADRLADATVRKRFAGEADVLKRVESPYVARVLDVGAEEDRLPYLAMELALGISLADQLRGGAKLGLETVPGMVRDVARGLGDCHRAEVVHRDVKPHNLVLTTVAGAPRWKLVDFGIARVAGAARATTGHVIVGTPAYMAPEQLAGHPADPRSDLYSLCLVVFRVLAGRPAFTAARVGNAHMRPPDLDGIAELPRDVGHVLRIGLADAPEDRFASASELEAAFEAAFETRLDEAVRARARALRERDPWT